MDANFRDLPCSRMELRTVVEMTADYCGGKLALTTTRRTDQYRGVLPRERIARL